MGLINTMMHTILVVEDEPLNSALLRRRLEKNGFLVLEKDNGDDAVHLLSSLHPDLILLDLSINGLDGWKVARKLKSSPKTSSIPIVAVTAHVFPSDRDNALRAGCDAFIPKPIDFSYLLKTISFLL